MLFPYMEKQTLFRRAEMSDQIDRIDLELANNNCVAERVFTK